MIFDRGLLFPNNRKGWNNRGWVGGRGVGSGLDIVIIINNRGVGGLDGVEKIVQAVS